MKKEIEKICKEYHVIDRDALIITEFLNYENDSPWLKKIQMANDINSKGTTIKQNSFVNSKFVCFYSKLHVACCGLHVTCCANCKLLYLFPVIFYILNKLIYFLT